MSQITKRALASALKELLEHKPLNKITIADITEQCGVNRQTFYYHFQDIYALLEWIYTTDAQRLLEGKRDGDTWQQGFLQVLEYIRLTSLAGSSFMSPCIHSTVSPTKAYL